MIHIKIIICTCILNAQIKHNLKLILVITLITHILGLIINNDFVCFSQNTLVLIITLMLMSIKTYI